MTPSNQRPPSEIESIRDQVRRVCGSAGFRRSTQLQTLLAYVVERAIENDQQLVKEYTLGVEVLGRDSDYDPRLDPIVRVRARNLRSRLEKYYSHEGAADAVLIEVPLGSYLPRITFRSEPPAAGAGEPPPQLLPVVAVLPFENLSGDSEQEYLSDGISEELINVLARLQGMRVVARTSAFINSGRV